ncbi:hypothetical protein ACPEIC_13460 [Stenotrophomonas sp. NPDC087984]
MRGAREMCGDADDCGGPAVSVHDEDRAAGATGSTERWTVR